MQPTRSKTMLTPPVKMALTLVLTYLLTLSQALPTSSSSSSSSGPTIPSDTSNATVPFNTSPLTTIGSSAASPVGIKISSTISTYHDQLGVVSTSSEKHESMDNAPKALPQVAMSPTPTHYSNSESGSSSSSIIPTATGSLKEGQFPTHLTFTAPIMSSISTRSADADAVEPKPKLENRTQGRDDLFSHHEDYQSDQYHHNPYHSHDHDHDDDEQKDAPGRDCVLPESWKGKWFQSGVSSPILIDSTSMGEKGTCFERSGDKFLFFASEKNQDCFRCIVINERHKNVLQYKESSYCEDKNSLENLCSQIPGDAQLYSLFRIDAKPEDCPFKGAPFTFTYNRGHGECKNPVSFVDTCTEPSKLLLRYQACPDVLKTESTAEELQCLAQWKEGSYHYLVGKLTRERTLIPSNEESYRCFIYEKTKGGRGGYTVAISGDATCTGISSSTEGARTLTFTKVEKQEGKCTFPSWMTSHHWHTLDGKTMVKLHHKNSTMLITEDSQRNSSGLYGMGSSMLGLGLPMVQSGGGSISSSGINAVGVNARSFPASQGSSLFGGGTKIVCQKRTDVVDGRHVAIMAKHTQGCKTQDICMQVFQRHKNVIEMQLIRRADHHGEDFDCGKMMSANGPNLPFVTLVNPEAKSNRCPNLGRYMTTGTSTDGRVARDGCGPMGQGGFHTLIVGCGDKATMEFHSKCATHNPISSYECHGSWEENGTGFLIASPLSRSSTSARRYCFNYQETEEGLRVVSSSESCRRKAAPGTENVWAFDLTIDGQCAQAVMGSGSGPKVKSCDLLILITLLSLIFPFANILPSTLVQSTPPRSLSVRPKHKKTATGQDESSRPKQSTQEPSKLTGSHHRSRPQTLSKFRIHSSFPSSFPLFSFPKLALDSLVKR